MALPPLPPGFVQAPSQGLTPVTPPTSDPGTSRALQAEQLRGAELENARRRRDAQREEGVETPGDPNLTGDAYLNSLPQSMRAQVRALSEGRIAWPTGRAATDPHWQQVIAATGQFDPTFDAANYSTRVSTRRNFTSGVARRNITALNTALRHLETLSRAGADLDNGSWPLINRVRNFARTETGDERANNFNLARDAVADEMERVFRGSAGSVSGVENWRATLNAAQSPDQLRGAIQQGVNLLHSRLESLGDEYNAGMGRSDSPISLLNPHAQEVMRTLGGAAYDEREPPNGPAPVVGGGGATPMSGGGGGGFGDGPPIPAGYRREEIVTHMGDAPPETGVSESGLRVARQMQTMLDRGATAEQLSSFAQSHGYSLDPRELNTAIQYRDRGGRGAAFVAPEARTPAGERASQIDAQQGEMGAGGLALHGFGGGLTDEAAGVGGAMGNAIVAPFSSRVDFDPIGAYQLDRDAERIRIQDARERTGWAGTIAEVGGGLAGGVPGSAPETVAPTLLNRMATGARGGAAIGTVHGFGEGQGAGSIGTGIVGGLEGATIGALLPVAVAGARGLGRGVRGAYRTITGNDPTLSRRIIGDAIEADVNTPSGVGAEMARAQSDDVPYMIADSGDNARGLLAASARVPGQARTLARTALEDRQGGLADRVVGHIERDLGPVSNPHEVSEQLMTQAQRAASPLYDAAYARPGADRFAARVQGMMDRPSMRSAMQNAYRIAQEEGRDPTVMGFELNSAGEVTLTRTPSWQTWDYVKRGLDDVLEGYRDTTTGRLNLNTYGRAANDTTRGFLREFDTANPDYAAARAAWAGPTRARAAMDAGRKALNMNADDLTARMKGMSPSEREMFRLGHRRAMAEHITASGDSADAVRRIVGTGKKRAALARLYDNDPAFDRFVSTLNREQEGFRTFARATQGSPTAANVADDANLANVTMDLAHGSPVRAALRQVLKYGAGRAGRNAQQEVSALLSETEPSRIGEFVGELRAQAGRRQGAARRGNRVARVGGNIAGQIAGARQAPSYPWEDEVSPYGVSPLSPY